MRVSEFPSLGDLADSDRYCDPIDTGDFPAESLRKGLRDMLVIRRSEEKIADMVSAGKIACPCHLAIGQEAVAVGISMHLRKTDRVFGAHRSHSHYLALGASPLSLFSEILGRVTGCSKGMGGSMHLYDRSVGFYGSVPIVSATIPLAVGAALAARQTGSTDVGVSYFGDGAVEEGPFHESMNFAANFKLPVLFVCENNFFSSHLHIQQRQPHSATARFAAAHCMDYEVVDGNDVIAVARAAQRLIEGAREGKGPGYLEAVTYRWRGHVGPSEDIDVGVKRKDDLVAWKRRDPVMRLVRGLEKRGAMTAADFEALDQQVRAEVEKAWSESERAPFPRPEALLDLVYRRS